MMVETSWIPKLVPTRRVMNRWVYIQSGHRWCSQQQAMASLIPNHIIFPDFTWLYWRTIFNQDWWWLQPSWLLSTMIHHHNVALSNVATTGMEQPTNSHQFTTTQHFRLQGIILALGTSAACSGAFLLLLATELSYRGAGPGLPARVLKYLDILFLDVWMFATIVLQRYLVFRLFF